MYLYRGVIVLQSYFLLNQRVLEEGGKPLVEPLGLEIPWKYIVVHQRKRIFLRRPLHEIRYLIAQR